MASFDVGGSSAADDDFESLDSTTEPELLKRAWRNEKAAPEILKFQSYLVDSSRTQITNTEGMIEDLTNDGVDPLIVSLYQMDLDRTLYLLRSYLRTRLQKIEKFAFYIVKTPEQMNRLSEQERIFVKRCAKDLESHLEQSVLSKLPKQYQSHLQQSEVSEDGDMVPAPHLDAFVIGRSQKFLGAYDLYGGGGEPVNIEVDHLYVLPYKCIKPLVETGKMDLV